MMPLGGIVNWLKSEWWMAKGRIEYKRNRRDSALLSFQKVVAIYPEHLLAQYYVGACYMSLLQYENAAAAFERGLQIRSDTAYCHAQLGRAYMYLCKNREAIESLNRAFRIDPKCNQNGIYLLALAAAYAREGETETSRKFYADAARLLPDNADAHHGLGWALRRLGRG